MHRGLGTDAAPTLASRQRPTLLETPSEKHSSDGPRSVGQTIRPERLPLSARPRMFSTATSTPSQQPDSMKLLLKRSAALLALTGLAVLTGCSTTQFTTTWRAPDAQQLHLESGTKVGALVVHPEKSVERAAEDALAAELNARGLQGVSAYSILGDSDVRDEAAARAAFAEAGAAAVVVMRGIGEQTEVDYRAPTYHTAPTYSGFWGGYYGYSWDTVYDPGYLRTTRIVTVETLVYDLESNKLIWTGHSRTVDPSKLGSFMKEIVDEAAKQMRKDGLIE